MAFGQAAMILSLGARGYRAVQPHASSMYHISLNPGKILLDCLCSIVTLGTSSVFPVRAFRLYLWTVVHDCRISPPVTYYL